MFDIPLLSQNTMYKSWRQKKYYNSEFYLSYKVTPKKSSESYNIWIIHETFLAFSGSYKEHVWVECDTKWE